MARKTTKTTSPVEPKGTAGSAMAYLEIAVATNQLTTSPCGKFVNLPWGAAGTLTHGKVSIPAKIGKGGKVVIVSKKARMEYAKLEKPAVNLKEIF